MCSVEGTTTTVTFVRESGDLPPLYVLPDQPYSEGSVALYFITYQYLSCECGRGEQACRGSFTLGLDGHHTVELPAAASSANISEALRALPPFFSATQRTAVGSPAGDLVVTVRPPGGGAPDQICRPGRTSMTIELRLPAGNQPALTLTTSFGNTTTASGSHRNATMGLRTMDGTTEREVCNAAGQCHSDTGFCRCDEFRGADSDVGDCGA